ncbi:protein spindle-F [Eurosta solidaginis]|uniref:protein spindle-F n=1 Tax=Eurosta solidaginis TaxID=178769 RepID=UPI003531340E
MESGPNSDITLASEYALRVALQTMKERCVVLQRRLTVLEEDNGELRERIEQGTAAVSSQNNNSTANTRDDADELLQLRLNVAELNRQKQQLSEHINMVSNENRKLWSRLSQIAKDKTGCTATKEQDVNIANEDADDLQTHARNGSGGSQNLIRSKTFTQHTPNPNLRHKLIPNGSELSMEEVLLDDYEQKGDLVEGLTAFVPNAEDDLGCAYLNVGDGSGESDNADEDFNSLAKKCMDALQEMRDEALKQQQELAATVTTLQQKLVLQPCKDCANKSQKPEMADKSLETDESLGEILLDNNKQESKGIKAWPKYEETEERGPSSINEAEDYTFIDVNGGADDDAKEIVNVTKCDRLCPMCGKKFDSTVPWEPFQQHVEAHFIETDLDF